MMSEYIHWIFKYFATSGRDVIWEQGDRNYKKEKGEENLIIEEIQRLGCKSDIVLWRVDPNGWHDIAAVLHYSGHGKFDVNRSNGYTNWPSFDAMTEEEAAEMYDGLLETFTGRKAKP